MISEALRPKGRASRQGIIFFIVPLDPASKAGFEGHDPVKRIVKILWVIIAIPVRSVLQGLAGRRDCVERFPPACRRQAIKLFQYPCQISVSHETEGLPLVVDFP
jgi:hypothetical protein